MKHGILLASITILLLSLTTAHAADVFRAEAKKITQVCGNGDLLEVRGSDIFISFDSQTQLTWSFTEDFERRDVLKMVQYFQSGDRADFVAIRSDRISPLAGQVEGGFSSMYGKVTLDANFNPVFVNGKLMRILVTSDGEECISFAKLKTVERVASSGPASAPAPAPAPDPEPVVSIDVTGTWIGRTFFDLEVTMTLTQTGSVVTGTYSDIDDEVEISRTGTVSGTVEGMLFFFEITITSPSCPGSFAGSAAFGVTNNILKVGYTGADCSGGENQSGSLVKQN